MEREAEYAFRELKERNELLFSRIVELERIVKSLEREQYEIKRMVASSR